MDKPLFPVELLKASQKERLDYYDSYTMGHPLLDDAFEQLKPIIRECGESLIIFIVGPTGAGKTKLVELARKWVTEQAFPQLETDRGHIPSALVEVVLPKSGLFNAKDHLKRCLYALNEPEQLIDYKIKYGVQGIYNSDTGELVIKPRIIETELGWALEQALKYRRPQIFLLMKLIIYYL